MLVGYMRVSSDSDRQTTDLQRDALLSARAVEGVVPFYPASETCRQDREDAGADYRGKPPNRLKPGLGAIK